MGVMGSFAGFLTFKVLRLIKVNIAVSGFMAGLLADWATYLTTSVELASGIKRRLSIHAPFLEDTYCIYSDSASAGDPEGAMTAGMVTLLYKKRPDLLVKMRVIKQEEAAI